MTKKPTPKKKKGLDKKSPAAKMRRDYLLGKGATMPQPPSPRFANIARKMLSGVSLGRHQYTEQQLEEFQDRFKDAIVWTDRSLPRQFAGRAVSIGVLGAIGKGVLWYGQEKMESFCAALGKGDFAGAGDPAHILWLWLTGRAKYNCDTAYRKTVSAIRAYVLGKQLTRERDGKMIYDTIHSAHTDLFEWDSSFTTMIKRHSNNSKKSFKCYPGGPTEEEIRIAEEVEEALASMDSK